MGGYYEDPDLYDATASGVAGDVAFYRDLALASAGPVVELGVGTGRIAIPVALPDVEVIGIDLAPGMLEVARRRAVEAGVADRVRLIEGDMRTFEVLSPVPLVTIPFRAFLHNLTVADQEATLAAAYRALVPGGRLALNVFNPDLALIARRMAAGSREEPFGRAGRIRARHAYDPPAQVVASRLRWRDADGRTRHATLTLRYVVRAEMDQLLSRAGFEVEALYGDCEYGAFEETSTEMVWVARRWASGS
jgi:ubiquinone/menaquinone biosynthesis C-methylase UbiE